MKPLDLVIVDDEKSARDLLKSLLEEENWIQILGEASNVDDAYNVILEVKPKVVLLDIQMPMKDGFNLIELLEESNIGLEVIFVTAYEQYAIKAIKASAFDYLLKPVKKKELLESLVKLSNKLNTVHLEDKFADLLRQLKFQKKIKFKTREGYLILDPDEIVYCYSDSNGCRILHNSGREEHSIIPLGKIEEILDKEIFCRISRTSIVNLKYIKQVNRKNMTCVLDGKPTDSLKISRKYINQLDECCKHLSIN